MSYLDSCRWPAAVLDARPSPTTTRRAVMGAIVAIALGCGDDSTSSGESDATTATATTTTTTTESASGGSDATGGVTSSATSSQDDTTSSTDDADSGSDGTSTGIVDGEPKWSRLVFELTSDTVEGNPFTADLTATFVSESGTEQTVSGYYDGDNSWKVAFMPGEVGVWTWTTSSTSPDLDGDTGEFNVVDTGNKGILREDPEHPTKWKYADGEHVIPMGVFVSAMLDPASEQEFEAMADFVAEHEINLLNFRLSEHDLAFEDVGGLQMHLERWQRLEQRLEVLAARGIGVEVMLYTDDAGAPSFGPQSEPEVLLIRYTVARLAAFPIVIFNTGIDLAEYRNLEWVNWYGEQVRSQDPYGHPVSSRYGGGSGNLVMEGQTFNSLGGRNSAINDLTTGYGAQPIPTQNSDNWSEDLPGDINGHSPADIRRAAWKAVIVGGVGFHVRHNTSNCFDGLLSECDRYFDAVGLSEQLDAEGWLAHVNPFIRERLGPVYGDMDPAPQLIVGGGGKYALADEELDTILVFSVGQGDTWDGGDGGVVQVDLGAARGMFGATWFDPRTGVETPTDAVEGGAVESFPPATNEDWVLLLER